MTREDALSFVDHHVRIVHGGPRYVQQDEPEGLIVAVTASAMVMRDARRPSDEPLEWQLASIARAVRVDAPTELAARQRSRARKTRIDATKP